MIRAATGERPVINAARDGTHCGCSGEVAMHAHAFTGQFVERRSLDVLVAVAANERIAVVIAEQCKMLGLSESAASSLLVTRHVLRQQRMAASHSRGRWMLCMVNSMVGLWGCERG